MWTKHLNLVPKLVDYGGSKTRNKALKTIYLDLSEDALFVMEWGNSILLSAVKNKNCHN